MPLVCGWPRIHYEPYERTDKHMLGIVSGYDGPHAALADTMYLIDQSVHGTGWGKQLATLYRVHDLQNSMDDDAEVLTMDASATPMPSRFAPDPEGELQLLVELLESPASATMVRMDSRRKMSRLPVAHIYVCEMWHNADYKSVAEIQATGLAIEDLQNTKRVRISIGVQDESVLVLIRSQFGEPEWADSSRVVTAGADLCQLMLRLHRASAMLYDAATDARAQTSVPADTKTED
jgi:hypothetical protein